MATSLDVTINLDLIQNILNYEYDLGLDQNVHVKTKGGSGDFDLVDKDRNAVVEVMRVFNGKDRGRIVGQIKSNFGLFRHYFGKRYRNILVVLDELNENDLGFLNKALVSSGAIEYVFLDINDLKRLANKFKLQGEFIIQNGLNSIESNDQHANTKDQITNEQLANNLIKKINVLDRKIYLVGANWDGKDLSDEFINNGRWENGYADRYLETIKSIKVGDLLILKSTFAKEGISKLRIKSIGAVTGNTGDGKNLQMEWISFDYFDIDDLGYYRETIMEPSLKDAENILLQAFESDSTLTEQLLSILEKEVSGDNESEVFIDKNQKFFVGLNVGEEIKDYDVIFLPKSSHGGIGQNGIAAHILEILGADREAFEFSESDLKEIKFKWNSTDLPDKRVELGFVVSKGEDKNEFDFRDNLEAAINNFPGPIIKEGKVDPPIKVFIPLLGTGQAGMSVDDSFDIIKDAIPLIQDQFRNPQIRINFPRDIERKNLTTNIRSIISLNKLQEIQNLEARIGQLYGEEFEDVEDVENIIVKTKDKIPFHLDQVVDEDKLGREPVAKAFVDLIKKDIFTEKLKHSFMVHLQGEWGAGKSSFLNFIKNHLNSDVQKEQWIIVEYNAWQNQHMQPPWWTLIDQIYRKSKSQLDWYPRIGLWRKEFFRRIWWYTGWSKVVAFVVFSVAIASIAYFGNDLMGLLGNVQEPTNKVAIEEKGFVLGVYGKLFLTLVSVIGGIYSFAKFITIPFFINSSSDAKSFVLKAADPMSRVKKHFNNLVDNINLNGKAKKRQLAIFIDDIDRCDKEFIVELLEGIQTLFKEKRILYIVAGDKNWITTSFGNVYKEFISEDVDRNRLGEFFLEKAFQLSFRLPNVSEKGKQEYWDHILGLEKITEEEKVNDVEKLSQQQQKEITSRVSNAKEELTNPEFMKQMEDDFNLTGDTVSNIVIEEKNKDSEEIKHLLKDFHSLIDTNPRSIIRLANNYTMTRSTLIAERRQVSEQKIFRWLVIEDLHPQIKTLDANSLDSNSLKESIEKLMDLTKRDNCLELLYDKDEKADGEITIEEIKSIKGR